MSRRPKPPNLRLIHGSRDRRKPVSKPAAGAPGKLPPCPRYLDTVGKRAWRDLGRLVTGTGAFTIGDRFALELACHAYQEWVSADALVREHGLTYTTTGSGGEPLVKRNPAVAIRSDAWRRLRLALIEFGLTPAARSKVPGEGPPRDPLDEFLDGA